MAIEAIAAEHFDAAEFDELIQTHGINVELRRGIACCIDPVTGAADPGCTVCEGWGVAWGTPETVRVSGADRKLMRQLERQGIYGPGDAFFTFPAETFVKLWDRFKLAVERIVVEETFTKGETNKLTGASRELTRFTDVLKVERATTTSRNPSTGHPYTTQLTELTEGVHFSLSGRRIQWLSAGMALVPDGQRYTLRYQTNSEYLVWAPRGRAENDVRMPYQYHCRRLDFIERVQGDEP